MSRAAHPILCALILLSPGALAPTRGSAAPAPRESKLWDGLRYPARGRYHDLVSEAEVLASATGKDPAERRRAEALLTEAIRIARGRPQAWHVLGRLHSAAGEHGRAADALARARKLDPAYQPRALGYAFGMACLRAGRYREAAAALEKLPRAKDPPRLRAMLLHNAAEAHLAAGHLATARGLFREAVVADLGYAPPRWGLAVATHRAERYAQAASLARAALRVDPGAAFLRSPRALYVDTGDRRYHEALAAEAAGDRAGALAAWRAFLREAPRSPWRAQAERALRRLEASPPEAPRRAPATPRRPDRPRGGR